MNRNDFNRFITEDAVPETGDLAGIREMTDLFPWFHSAHLVLLRGLKENSDIKFETQLKNSALFIADREVLYHYLFMKPAVPERQQVQLQAEVSEEAPEEIKSIAGVVETGEVSQRSKEELIAEIESRLEEITVSPESPPSEETVFEIELGSNYSTPPADREEKSVTEDEELLELSSPEDDELVADVSVQKLTPDDLIDRFIKTSPRLERPASLDPGPVRDLSEVSTDEGGAFITETLARIYVNQGYYFKAINIYEKLTLKYPEKSAYFASRIEKIKELIK